MSNNPKFIVIEGVDGSGKSTQAKLVAEAVGVGIVARITPDELFKLALDLLFPLFEQ